jgi:hypothetical protein
MVQWRRYYDTNTHRFDKITAMAVSPDGTKLVVHANLEGSEDFSYIFMIRASDGGHDSEVAIICHGQIGFGEQMVSDSGIVFGTSNMVYLAFK